MLQRLCALLIAFLFIFTARASAQQKVVTLYNNPSLVQVISPTPVNSGTSIAATFSTTPTVGNLMVCALSSLSGSYVGPTGWTVYQSASNSGIQIAAFYRIVQSGDATGPYTFTDGTSTSLHLGCEEFANVDPVSPFIASASAIGTLHSAGSILFGISRSTLSGSLPLIFSAMAGNATALQAGWTNDWDSQSSNNAISGHAQRFTPMANGATWQPNVAYSAGGSYVILQLVLHTKLPPNNVVGNSTGGGTIVPTRSPIVAYVGGQYAWLPDPSITQAHVDYPQMEPFSHQLPPYFGNVQCPVGSPCSPWAYLDTNTQNCTNDEIDVYNQANVPANENWFLHTATPISSSNRVKIASPGKCIGPDGNSYEYYLNTSNSNVRNAYVARYSNRIATPKGLSPINQAIMADNNRPYCNVGVIYEYACPSSGSNITAITNMRTAEAQMIAAFTPSRVMCNGMGPGGGFYGQGTGDGVSTTSPGGAFHYAMVWTTLYTPSNLIGCIHEGILRRSLESGGVNNGGEVNARIAINDMSQILNTTTKDVVILDYAMQTDCSSTYQLRREHQALKMLIAGNWLNRVLDWEASYVPTTTCIAAFPEQEIYFKNPLKAMGAWSYNSTGDPSPELPFSNGSGCMNRSPSGSHTPDLRSTGGVADLTVSCPSGANNSGIGTDTGGNPAAVWAREYNDCYYEGTRFGHCAAIFNATSQPVTIPIAGLLGSWTHYNYTHAIGWTGNVMPWACPISAGCNGAINLTASSVTMGTTQIPGSDAILLAP